MASDPISGSTIVLCYHAVSKDWPSALAVSPDDLKRQAQWFLRRGFRPMTFSEALTRSDSEPAFVVSFDDAYRSVLTAGSPVLQELGVPGTVFVPTRADQSGIRHWEGIDEWSDSEWRAELRGTTWQELAQLRDSGWEIGSHTRSHPDLRTLDDEALRDELEGSKLDCEENLGMECTSLAYPYGHVDQRVARAAHLAGYKAAAALDVTDHSASEHGRLSWPRLSLYRRDTWARFVVKRIAFTHAHWVFGLVQSARR
jgi:peptidoglycan/xylan/chitin deacetylase (PgdA/CDA1 family)